MTDKENRFRQALINELAAMFACEGCPHPYSWHGVEERIEPLTKEETASVLEEADKINLTDLEPNAVESI